MAQGRTRSTTGATDASNAQDRTHTRARRRLSLSLRFSLLVLLAALLPLAAVVAVNDYLSRPTLIQQGRTALSTDANAKVDLIQQYIVERLLDGEALASVPTSPAFLICASSQTPPPTLNCPVNETGLYGPSVQRALNVGIERDHNYTLWSLYDTRGHLLLSSDKSVLASGGVPVPPEDLTPVQQGNQWISAVYYDPQANHAYVRIYTPITPTFGQKQPVVGFLQATLRLDYIWGVVKSDQGANGSGSTAFITDEHGIRIADPNAADLFTAIQPLDANTQSLIASEQRYGNANTVPVDSLSDVASSLQSNDHEASFVGAAQPGSHVQYQFVRIHVAGVPWTYFTLSPLATVTQVADDQLRTSLIIAGIIAILAALIGLFIGMRTARPVESSAVELTGAAATLKALAARQQGSAGEQHWVVDACKTGLDGVRYLSDAMNQAAKRLIDASQWFNEYWDRLTEEQARRTVQHLQELAHYIDEAARRQQASAERLDKAITVTMQVSDQLLTGATEATQSAIQLEGVVRDLQRVVGGRARSLGDDDAGVAEALPPMSHTPVLPSAQAPRALPAPVAAAPGSYAPRAPRPAWGSKSQLGGWDAYNEAVGGAQNSQNSQMGPGSQIAPQYNGSYNGYNNGYNNGYGSPSQMGYDMGNDMGDPWSQQAPDRHKRDGR